MLYTRAAALFRDLALARADGSQRNLLARLSRVDVLVVDDWAMAPMQESERRDFWEICEERYQTRSTILTSQVPVVQWHEQIGDATSPTVSSTGSCTTLIASSCAANPCARHEPRRRKAKRKRKPDNPALLATEAPAASLGAGVGQGASNASPLPHAPIPAPQQNNLATLGENSSSLTISITSRDNQSRQRRCAPTLIGIAGTLIAFTPYP